MNQKIKLFPRKEVYVCTFPQILGPAQVVALNSYGDIQFSDNFKAYAEGKWETDNKGWRSSVIPSAIEVEYDQGTITIHCGLTEYKFLLGQVKLAYEKGQSGLSRSVHGLSTETFPLTPDDMIILEHRSSAVTQHGIGFYDIPTAGQNAQMYFERAQKDNPGLIRDIFDMFGFPVYNLIRHLKLEPREIGEIRYVGFSRGFECSLDSQFNSIANVGVEGRRIMKRLGDESENKMIYRLSDMLDILDCIGKNGKNRTLKEDMRGKKPQVRELTGEFGIVDDCLGTLLSVLWHLEGTKYMPALDILRKKGYTINEVKLEPRSRVVLDDLV